MTPKFKIGDIIEDNYAIERIYDIQNGIYLIKLVELKIYSPEDKELRLTNIDVSYADFTFRLRKDLMWNEEMSCIINEDDVLNK